MEEKRERELARGLADFDAVWARVTEAKSPRETAARLGVALTPRRGRPGCCAAPRGRGPRPRGR